MKLPIAKAMFWKKKISLRDLDLTVAQSMVIRRNFSIAIIDDKGFPLIEELRRHEFNLTLFEDIDRISVLSEFDIIITDIKGVGKKLGSTLGGAHVIEEVSKKYPTKYLIAYSASWFSPDFNSYFSLCDVSKKKGIDVSDWVSTLDNAIFSISNPIYQWEKIRKILISKGTSSEIISSAENAFTKSIYRKNHKIFEKWMTTESRNPDLKVLKIVFDAILTFAQAYIATSLKN